MLNWILFKNLINTVELIAFIICIFIATYIYNKDPKNKENIFFSITCVLGAYTIFSSYNFKNSVNYEEAIFWYRFRVGAYIGINTATHFLFSITKKSRQKLYRLYYYITVLISVVLSINYLYGNIYFENGYWQRVFHFNSSFNILEGIWYIVIFFIFVIEGWKFYINTDDNKRKMQFKYMCSLLIGPFIGAAFILFKYKSYFEVLGSFMCGMFSYSLIFVAYGMKKYSYFCLNPAYASKNVLEMMVDCVFLVDYQWRISMVNRSVTKLLNYRKDELIGGSFYKIIDKEYLKGCFQKTNSHLEEDKKEKISINDLEVCLYKKNGQRVSTSVSVKEIKDKNLGERKYVFIFRDLTERKRMENELEYYSKYDGLTGVFNRRAGMKNLREEIQKLKAEKSNLTICFIDIDGLKKVNDSLGHRYGDELITNTIKLIKSRIRKEDIICRMGGDEFLLIFPNFTEKEALEILQEVEDSISEFNLKKNKRYRISFSYGFAEYYWNDDMSIDELIGIADSKMYKIKNIKKHSNKDFKGK